MIELSVWKYLTKKRAGVFLGCLLVPVAIVWRFVINEQHDTTQRLIYVSGGVAIGVMAFVVLSLHDWLRRRISLRQTPQDSAKSLMVTHLFVYFVVLPILLFVILLGVVIIFF